MLYYADRAHEIDPREIRDRVVGTLLAAAGAYRRRPETPCSPALETHPALVEAAIALGELHQAVADLLGPARDDVFPEVDRLTTAGALVGRCLYRSARGLRGIRLDAALPEAAARAVAVAVPNGFAGRLESRVPEGYAYYSLYPEMYLESLARALGSQPRSRAFAVLGIRSIGTSLATLVAGALVELGFEAAVETLRPRGHPFDRFVDLASTLRDRLLKYARERGGFIIVDEGPGLTCSSFLSVCSALATLGIGEERVSILSAWQGAPSIYASDEARARWKRLRVFHTGASEAFEGWRKLLPFVRQALPSVDPSNFGEGPDAAPAIEDLSYGRWRERCFPSPDLWPVVHRSTERTKLLIRFPTHQPLVAKFAGLGEYGRQKHERAAALGDSGFSPRALGLAHGFLLHPFVANGRPMAAQDLSTAVLARLVEYYAFVAGHFPLPPAPRFDQLAEMITVNTREALALDASAFVDSWRPWQDAVDWQPLALLDGRPQPHEWLDAGAGTQPRFLKTDSSDHARDHTLVGEQSILWDLAGSCEEWQMDGASVDSLLGMWERRTGDRLAREILDLYRAAYLAFRAAALHYAIHSTNEEEIRRSLQHEEWRYRTRLREAIGY